MTAMIDIVLLQVPFEFWVRLFCGTVYGKGCDKRLSLHPYACRCQRSMSARHIYVLFIWWCSMRLGQQHELIKGEAMTPNYDMRMWR